MGSTEGEPTMKKRLLSLLLTVCLVAALFTGLTGTASAADDKVVGYLTSYTLKAGDSIYSICDAKKIDFNTSLATIGKINNITNYNYMMPGRVIWLPTKTASTSEAYYSLLSHTLVAGETPAALCQSYGIDYNTSYKLLAALNNNLNVFMAGQTFILPIYVTPAGAATPTPAPSASAKPGTSAAPSASAKPGTTPAPTANIPSGDTVSYYLAQHTLKYGETVSGVCAALGVDFGSNDATIRKINNITNYNYMMPGKVILIPTKTVPTSGSYYKIMAHKIVSGDTIFGLCSSYGLNYYTYSNMIGQLNPNLYYNNMIPGSIVYMPQYVAAPTVTVKPTATASAGTTAAPTASTAPTASAAPSASAAAGTSASPAASATAGTTVKIPEGDQLSYLIVPHKIQYGDTVTAICQKYSIDFAESDAAIQRLNPGLSYNYMVPGNIILIPTTTYPSSGPYYKIWAHTLAAGETVYDLCLNAYGLSYVNNVTFLQRLNNRDNLAAYYVGQTIYMPEYISG